jgi:hypothetical protein
LHTRTSLSYSDTTANKKILDIIISLTIVAGSSKMIVAISVSFIGAFITTTLLWPYGPLLALISAPFGGSFLALLAGLLLTFRKRKQERSIPASCPSVKAEEAA